MSKHTRRQFLENSMLAAAAASIAGQASAPRAFADEGSSPGERLGVAVLGVRGQGNAHLAEYQKRKDCQIVAIVDPDEAIGQSRVEAVEKASGNKPAYYKDPREAFEDGRIDIVSIATPNHWHALAAIWAIQTGKDVYVEKPVSHNVQEGRRIVEAARKHGKIVQTGTQCRSMTGTADAIEYLQAGKIGDVTLARGLCYKRRPAIGARGSYEIPASVDYNVWLGPAPDRPLTRPKLHYDWHWQWDYGNGDLGNQGIHQMDICRWGLGVDDIGESVLSYGGRLGYTDAGETANTQVCVHDYGDRRIVFEVRGLETQPFRGANVGVIFYGSDGYVVLPSYTGGAAFDLDGKLVQRFNGGQYADHFDNFIQAVRSRRHEELAADILEGHLSSALCHLGNISYLLGEEMTAREALSRLESDSEAVETFDRFAAHLADNKVELETTKIQFGPRLALNGREEVFTGERSAEANPLLTREYRKGFVVPESKNL